MAQASVRAGLATCGRPAQRGLPSLNTLFGSDTPIAPVLCHRYDAERAWLHFIMFGYREGRPYRFAC